MCNTNIENNCCHEDDLLCCMPVMHCCGGYSEHNNCCPHNRCCNHPCCCDDGCPFTPECCCCKALKCCKKNKEKIEAIESTINSIESTIIRDELKHDSDISNINNTIEDISNVIQLIIEDVITDISYNNTTKYITYKTKNGSPVNVVKVAPLDNANKIPSEYLPSYVDDVIEGYYYNNAFYLDAAHTAPITGEHGKIYVDLTSGGNNTYRYVDNQVGYIEVSPTKFGKTAGTAYEGNNGAALESGLSLLTSNVLTHFNNTDIHVLPGERDAWGAKYNKPSGGIPKSDLELGVQTSLDKANSALLAHQNIKSLSTAYSPGSLTPLANESIVGTGSILLHHISKTGDWGDLVNKPSWIGSNKPTYNLDEVSDGDTRKLSNYALISSLGTAAYEDVPVTGNASTTQVVMGNDSRLTDARTPVSHTHTKSEITDFPTNVSSFTNDAGYITSSDIPAIPAAQILSDWNLSNTNSLDYIKNKPSWIGNTKPTYTLDEVSDGSTRKLSDYVKKVKVGQSGTELAPDNNGVVTLPEYPTASSINITIGGTSYNLETLLTNITNDITALKGLWESETDGGYTYLKPVTNGTRVKGAGFFDTTVS